MRDVLRPFDYDVAAFELLKLPQASERPYKAFTI